MPTADSRPVDRAGCYQALAEVLSHRSLSTEERIGELLSLGNRLFATEVAIFSRIVDERYVLRAVAAPEHVTYRPGDELPLKDTYCFHALLKGGPLAIDHMSESPWAGQPCHVQHRFESYLGAPVELEGEVYGSLHFSSWTPRVVPFGELELDLIRLMSEWMGSVVEGERLRQSLERREEQYRDLVENSLDLIATHDLDGRILTVNRALVRAYGARSPEELVGTNVADLMRPASRSKLSEYLGEIEGREVTEGHMTVRIRSGEERLLEYRNTLRRSADGPPVVRVTARDVTELQRAQTRLRESEELLGLFVRYAPAAVAMFDRDMRYLAVSDRWLQDFRLNRDEVLGRLHDELFPAQADHWRDIREVCVREGRHLADEDPVPGKDGTLEWIHWEVHPWSDADGEIGGLMMYTDVITDRKRVEEAWRYMATHDHLTGLLNRQSFLDRLERSVERLRHQGDYRFAVFFLDLDGFKAVNDTYGHTAGDRLLKRVGERLQSQLRPKDALARFAGDEFVALVEDVGEGEALEIADRVTEQVRRPYQVHGRVVGVAVSLGISLARSGVTAESLLEEADGAMYEIKARSEPDVASFLLAEPVRHEQTG